MLRFIICLAAPAILAAGPASEQPAAKVLRFEVASIKAADPDAHNISIRTDRAGGLIATNVILSSLITAAYGIRDFQLTGAPGWVRTERFDIVAKTERSVSVAESPDAGNVPDERWLERIRSLLADRFGLVVRKDTRVQPVYVLTVARNGLRLTAVSKPPGGTSGGRGRSQGYAANMEMVARVLAQATGRPVIDKTGLTGNYDYVLEWTPDAAATGLQGGDAAPSVDNPGPTIFTALQEQLGLKLESTKGLVDVVVIDHVDRPSAN